MSLRLRWAFYGATLGLIVLQSISALMAGTSGDSISSNETLFRCGMVSAGVSLVTWLWVFVLLSYHWKPESTQFLTRAYVHFTSFCIIALSELVLGSLLLSQVHRACNAKYTNAFTHRYMCATPSLAGGLGLTSSVFAVATALIIKRTAAPFSSGLKSNIAHLGPQNYS